MKNRKTVPRVKKAKAETETPVAQKKAAGINEDADALDVIIEGIKKRFNNKKEKSGNKQAANISVPAISKKALVTGLVVFLVSAVLVLQIVVAVKKQMSFNKKPVLAARWAPSYTGQIGMPVWREHMYIIDNAAMKVIRYKKMTGEPAGIIDLKSAPRWALENSKGETLVMISGDENINIFEGSKLIRKINIPGSAAASNAVIDSEDNIYIPYNSLGKIIKYSPDGDKLIEFGGKDKFRLLSRIFIDSKNRIYVLDYTPPFNVFVYDSEGKQIRKFALKVKNFRGPEGLAITDDGNIYFNDMNENCIRVYSQSGKLIGKFSSDSGGTVGIGAPGAIGGGQDNYVYIAGLVFNPVKY